METILYVSAKVSESNISIRILQNTAEILNDQIKNKNDVTVIDTTPNNNQDADYIQLKDIVISGTVLFTVLLCSCLKKEMIC